MSISASSPVSPSRSLIYPVSYFASTDGSDKVIYGDQQVRDIGELLRSFPQAPIAHPALKHSNQSQQVFVFELMSHMDAYWDHFHDVSLAKELSVRLQKRSEQLRMEESIIFERLDILQAYILSMLFERIFLNSLARKQTFLESKTKSQAESVIWQDLHREQKIRAKEEPSRLLQQQFSHPFQFAIRRPNQLKMMDLLRFATLQNKSLLWDSVALSRHQSHRMSQFFGKHWNAATMELQDALRRQQPGLILSRLRWIVELFAHSWNRSWQSNADFQELVRDQIWLRAGYFPELYQQSGHINPKLELTINNDPQAIQQALLDRHFWQQIVVDALASAKTHIPPASAQNSHNFGVATSLNQSNHPPPYQWLDRTPHDPHLQPQLSEQIQREWHIQNNSGVQQAAVNNAQFETALANPYGFIGKRLHSRQSLMETALQNQKQADLVAPTATLLQQADMQRLQQVHIEICKLLAGVDYAASQQYKHPLPVHLDAALDSRNIELTRIDKVKKSSAA